MQNRTVIAIVNRKGGTAKTTSAAYIATCLQNIGHKVTGVDADNDKSWLKWRQAVSFPYEVIEATREKLKEQVESIEGDIVIDTPPNDGEIVFDVSEIADEVIIPLAPTGLDVNRLITTVDTVSKVERLRGKALGSVLLTKWRENFVVSKEVEEALKEKNMPLLDARIRQLTRYTRFDMPIYLEEYQTVLTELGVVNNAKG